MFRLFKTGRHRHGYILPVPILLDALDSASGWTPTGGTLALVGPVVQGTGALEVTGDGATTGQYITATATLNPSTFNTVAVCADIQPPVAADLTSVSIYFGQGATNMQITFNTPPFRKGKRWFAANVPFEGEALSLLGSATTTKRLKGNELSGGAKNCVTTWDALYTNCSGRPTVILTHDDVCLSHYQTLYPLMVERGLVGTLYIPPGYVGSSGVRMTLAQLQAMYASGWDCGVDSWNDQPYTVGGGYANDAASIADMADIQAYLVANGMSRGMNHLCYPNGTWSESLCTAMDAAGVIHTARTTEPQSTFDRFGLGNIGKTIGSMGMTGAQTTAAIIAQIDLIIARGATQFFYNHDVSECVATISTASTTTITVTGITSGSISPGMTVTGTNIPASTTITSQLTGDMGGTGTYVISHQATGTASGITMTGVPSSIGWSTTKMITILDYIKAKKDAGLLDVLTVSQYWARVSNATIP